MERRDRRESGGGGFGALIGLAIGALVGAGIAYLANKITEECNSEGGSSGKTQSSKQFDSANSDVTDKTNSQKLAESGITDPDQDEFIKHFLCPITRELMNDPVVTPSMHRFERKAIEDWIRRNGTCPITRDPLRLDQLRPDRDVKSAIEGYIKHQSKAFASR